MVKRIRVKNFKSLKDVDLELRPLNVLIGPNASGKSNLLSVFELLRQGAEGNLADTISDWGGMRSVIFRNCDSFYISPIMSLHNVSKENIAFSFNATQGSPPQQVIIIDEKIIGLPKRRDANSTIYFELERSGNMTKYGIGPKYDDKHKKNSTRDDSVKFTSTINQADARTGKSEFVFSKITDYSKFEVENSVFDNFRAYSYFSIIEIGLKSLLGQGQMLKPGITLRQDGSNLLSILTNVDPDTKEEIEEYIRSVFPEFKLLRTTAGAGAGQQILEWYEKPHKEPFYINQISDGALRLLYLLALLIPKSDYKLICIEEPELGLHPESIKILASVLKRVTDMGDKQIIVSTHSAQLVDQLDVEDVVVTEKIDGATTFRRLEQDMFSEYLHKYRLGELWVDGHFEE